jgi:hypothetical protein
MQAKEAIEKGMLTVTKTHILNGLG